MDLRALSQHQVIGFGTVLYYRLGQEIARARRQPLPGSNVFDEVLRLAGAASARRSYDLQRVYELLGIRTGHGVAMCFHNAEAKLLGAAIDLTVRMIARPDQAAVCAARLAQLSVTTMQWLYADGRIEASERAYQEELLAAIAKLGRDAVTTSVLGMVPEHTRPPLGARAHANVGQPWTESFGGAISSEPTWRDPWGDDLDDGNDPITTRTGHVEGW